MNLAPNLNHRGVAAFLARGATAWSCQVGLLAAAYYVSGWLGLLLAIPPGFATAIWPPAGIALAVVLWRGNRIVPGVWLGSFALNLVASLNSHPEAPFLPALVVAASLGLGATLQTLAAAYLVRRYVGFPNSLIDVREIVSFLLLGGPVGCLVGATWGVGTLLLAGAISVPQGQFTWWTWWVGDTIGVLVLAPLLVLACVPGPQKRTRLILVGGPILAAFAISVGLFSWVSAREVQRKKLEFERRAAEMSHRMESQLNGLRDQLHFFSTLYETSGDRPRAEFQPLVSMALARRHGLLAISWNERLLDRDRSAFEAAAQRDGQPDFQVRQRSAQGELEPADQRPEYVVIRRVEPFPQNQATLGLDVWSLPERRTAMELARDTGCTAPSTFTHLVQRPERTDGVILFLPVYRDLRHDANLAARRQRIAGYVAGVLLMGDMVHSSLDGLDDAGIEFQIEAQVGKSPPVPLFASPPSGTFAARSNNRPDAKSEEFRVSYHFLGGNWLFRFRPTGQHLGDQRTWEPWFVLASGLLFTQLLGAFLLTVTGQRVRTEQLVHERTAELSHAYARLESDIAARKRTEVALHDQRERLQLALENSQHGMWDWDIPSGRLVLDENWHAILGYLPGELALTFNTWEDSIHPDDKARVLAVLKQHLAFPASHYDVDYRGRHKSGEWIWVNTRGRVCLWDAEGRPWRMIGTIHDVSARKQAELKDRELKAELEQRVFERTAALTAANVTLQLESARREKMTVELQESAAKFRDLYDNAPDMYFSVDVQTGCIREANRTLCLMLGYPKDEIIGRPVLDFYHPDSLDAAKQALQRFISLGTVCEAELQLKRHDGSPLDVSLNATAVRDNVGKIISSRSVWSDITDRKRAEAAVRSMNSELEQLVAQRTSQLQATNHELISSNVQLEAAREAAWAANQSKSEFLANMSHEIRTPMTAILGFTDLLREECRDSPSAVQGIDTIQRNGNHLLEIINDILDLSKIESGKLEVERISCSPVQLVCEATSLMQIRADGKGISLKTEFKGPIPQRIQTDPTRLRQILLNLLGNAIKFTEVGSVRLVTELEQVADEEPRLRFSVYDSGIGMTPEQLQKLFQPFTQADTSTTRKFGGTGLGLTISRRLAALLDGDISVTSTPGAGSCFSVTVGTGSLAGVSLLEVGESSATTTATVAAVSPGAAASVKLDCRVLLAEDGPDNQRLISFVLRKAGAIVTVADNGLEAKTQALEASEPFDVILMDMQMPIMDGYEATRQLRAAGYTRPIIALTAHAMEGDRAKCLAAGCTDYTTKPIERQGLLELVARYASAGWEWMLETSDGVA